jgi:hypothetical protein
VDGRRDETAAPDGPAAANAASRLFAGPHNVARDARTKGLPRWASVSVAVTFVVGTALAVLAYVVTRSLLVAGVCAGIAYLIGLAILSMVSVARPTDSP